MSTYIFIPGNNPPLSIAELNARYKDVGVEKIGEGFIVIKTDAAIDQNEFDRIGGFIKVAEIIMESSQNKLMNNLTDILASYYQGKKLDYGISVYGFPEKQLRNILLNLKKELKKNDIKTRFINNNFTNISAAQYKSIKNNGLEIVIIKSDGEYYIGKVVGVQDIDAYSKRDYEKPFRDMQMGMLPPKLAQILINLTGSCGKIWDPFCGSGTIVMEGLLMGITMIGSDINIERVNGAKKNVDWLKKEFKITSHADLFAHDATKPIDRQFDAIAFEGDLGIPHSKSIHPDKLQSIMDELDNLYVRFFENLKLMKCKAPIICALPFYRLRDGKEFDMEKTIERIEKMGFARMCFCDNNPNTEKHFSAFKNTNILKYSRQDQAVGRAIYKFRLA